MLSFATHNVHTASQQSIFPNSAFTNVTLRAYVHPLVNLSILLWKKQRGETDENVWRTRGHDKPIKART